MTKVAGILPAGRNPSAPEGSVKPAPPPNPPKAQGMVDGWRLVVRYGEYDSEPSVWAEKDGSLVWIATMSQQPEASGGVGAPGSHAWMAEVCRAAALSLAAHGVCNDQLLKVADWIAQQGGES